MLSVPAEATLELGGATLSPMTILMTFVAKESRACRTIMVSIGPTYATIFVTMLPIKSSFPVSKTFNYFLLAILNYAECLARRFLRLSV